MSYTITVGKVPAGAVIAKQKYDKLKNSFFGEEYIENGIFTIDEATELYAVGDIHGDSLLLKHVLVNLTNAVNIFNDKDIHDSKLEDLRWNLNNSSYIVFCGDLIDRTRDHDTNYSLQDENSDLEIIKTLDRLDREARNYRGRVLILLGNHEMMNFNQNFDYVSNMGMYENRELDFKPGSLWANYISDNCFTVIKINNLIFTHGGFCINFIRQFKKFDLSGNNIIGSINHAIRIFLEKGEFSPGLAKIKDLLFTKESVLFCRDFGFNKYNCKDLDEIFDTLNMDPDNSKMIIGHSIQDEVNSICDDRVWRIDLGLSRAFNDIELTDYELIEYKLTADNGFSWLINFLKEKLNKFINSEEGNKTMSIIKFKFEVNNFNDVEIITKSYNLLVDNYNILLDKLILYFRSNNKEYHVQLLNKLKDKKIKFYPIEYHTDFFTELQNTIKRILKYKINFTIDQE
jgi:hypothetical protein